MIPATPAYVIVEDRPIKLGMRFTIWDTNMEVFYISDGKCAFKQVAEPGEIVLSSYVMPIKELQRKLRDRR